MIACNPNIWIGHQALRSITHAIENAKNAGDPIAAQTGIEITDILGERGHLEIRGLRRDLFKVVGG